MSTEFGVMASIGPSIQDTVQSVHRLEAMGLDSAWFSDHLVSLGRRDRCLDPWPIMAAVAPYTGEIMFGSMVADPFRRHPAVFAQTLATVDWVSRGRLGLGIGAGEAMNVVPFNIPWDQRARRLEESIRVMRLLWTGETIDFEGSFYRLNRAFIQALPFNRGSIPVYVAANSPLTRRIAGRLGDGWIAEMMSPEFYRKDLGEVAGAAKEAGRSMDNFDVTYHAFLEIAQDGEEAKDHARDAARRQFTWWPRQLERHGYRISDKSDWNRLVVDERSSADSQELSLKVPMEAAENVIIAGNTDDCIGRIEDYIEAGVTHFAFSIVGKREETLKTLGEKVVPYFKQRRE